MRVLRNKIEEIWEFEAKVERSLAVVSLSMNEIDETLTYLEKTAIDPDDFFRKNVRRISPEDRYRASWLVQYGNANSLLITLILMNRLTSFTQASKLEVPLRSGC